MISRGDSYLASHGCVCVGGWVGGGDSALLQQEVDSDKENKSERDSLRLPSPVFWYLELGVL